MKLKKLMRVTAFLLAVMLVFSLSVTAKATPVNTNPKSNEEEDDDEITLEGKGTKENPYKIKTDDDLMEFATLVNSYEEGHVCRLCAELTADIELNDTFISDIRNGDPVFSHINEKNKEEEVDTDDMIEWDPIGYYEDEDDYVFYGGTFDGNNHNITGLYIDDMIDYAGLFGLTFNATIRNLTIGNSFVRGCNLVGGFSGFSDLTAFKYCRFDDRYSFDHPSIIGGNELVGGICGVNWDEYDDTKGLFKNQGVSLFEWCSNYGSICANEAAGGVAGEYYYGAYKKCFNLGTVFIGTEKNDNIFGEIFYEDDETDGAVAPTNDETQDAQGAGEQVEGEQQKAGQTEGSVVDDTKQTLQPQSGDTTVQNDISNTGEGSEARQENENKTDEIVSDGAVQAATVKPAKKSKVGLVIVIAGTAAVVVLCIVGFVLTKRRGGLVVSEEENNENNDNKE